MSQCGTLREPTGRRITIRKGLWLATAATLPFASLGLMGAQRASARDATALAGENICNISGTILFNPSLAGQGEPGVKEIVTFSLNTNTNVSATACTAKAAEATSSITTGRVKLRGVPIGSKRYGGSMSQFLGSLSALVLKSAITWPSFVTAKRSKVTLIGFNLTEERDAGDLYGERLGFSAAGSGTGSFAGPVNALLFLDRASSDALLRWSLGAPFANGLVFDSLTIDPDLSTLTLGGCGSGIATQAGLATGSNGDVWLVVLPAFQYSPSCTPIGTLTVDNSLPTALENSGADHAITYPGKGPVVNTGANFVGVDLFPGQGDPYGTLSATDSFLMSANTTFSYSPGNSVYLGF